MARICLAGIVTGLLLLASSAAAHDEAWWIQEDVGAPEGGYRTTSGIHCCSKDHCNPPQPGEIARIDGGWLHVPTQTRLMDAERGVYQSIQLRPFACVWGNALRCFFWAAGA